MRVVSNSQLNAAAERMSAQTEQLQPQLTGLAGHIERFWQAAQTAKRPIEQQMFRALRQRTGIYEPDELALIRQTGGSEIYMMLTSAKCRGAESWLREILLPETERPWGLEPTPMPDLPPPVMAAIVQSVAQLAMAARWEIDDARIDEKLLKIKQLAFKRMKDVAGKIAERHELKIADQFAQGGMEKAISSMIYDLVTFPASFIKGPIRRRRKVRRWMRGPNGQWIPQITDAVVKEWERRSPFDLYPAPGMRDMRYGNIIDRYRFTREELQSLIGVPGYSTTALEEIIKVHGDRGYRSARVNDAERARLERRLTEEYDPEGNIEALNFWGTCSGHMLMEWGWKNDVKLGPIEPTKEYQVEAWKTAGYVFKAVLNPDPLGLKPYTKCSLEEIPDAFWGLGMPDLIADSAQMCNASARAIANNAAIASGPQVEIYVDRLAEGEKVTQPYPWKLYQMASDSTGGNQRAVQFWQPNMNVQELLMIYTHFERVSDNVSGFPNFTYGDSRVGGAGRTSSGLAQLMGNVGKGVRRVIAAVDREHIRPQVQRAYDDNMEFDPDPTIKFDLTAVARGTASLLIKDSVQQRRLEMLQATANPLDAGIIGVPGRAEMLRETLRAAEFDTTKIIPDALELELLKAALPPPHELLGNTGPNAPNRPGMTPGGGTPEGVETTDLAGNPPQGVEQRQQQLGYAGGGVVRERDRHGDAGSGSLVRRPFRLRRAVDEDGIAVIDVEPL